MNPDPVRTTGTASFSLSAPATLTVRIVSGKGALVRNLLLNAETPAGQVSALWDRKDATGRKMGRGTYRLEVEAVDAAGQRATATRTFAVA